MVVVMNWAFLNIKWLLLIPIFSLFHNVINFGNSYSKSSLYYLLGVLVLEKCQLTSKKHLTLLLSLSVLIFHSIKLRKTILKSEWSTRFKKREKRQLSVLLSRNGMKCRVKLELIRVSSAVCGFSSCLLRCGIFWSFHCLLPFISSEYLKKVNSFGFKSLLSNPKHVLWYVKVD